VKLWQTGDGSLARTIRGHELIVWSVAFSPDSRTLASGSFDRTVRLWRVADGAPLRTMDDHGQAVLSVAFSPDGTRIVSGSDDKTVKVWRASDGALLHTMEGSSQCVYEVAFTPDGRFIASASRDATALGGLWKHIVGPERAGSRGKTLRLWRASDGTLLQTLTGHTDDVHGLALSPDGRWLATGSVDRTVALWELVAGG
jgi:WD40 repeat protein